MIRALAVLLALFSLAAPAQAHRLKVFAAVTGYEVSGYAFFIGSGRPRGVAWSATDGAGVKIATGTTDEKGRFAFSVSKGFISDMKITVDTHDAHVASLILPATRFGGPAAAEPKTPLAAVPHATEAEGAALVEAAVQRQVEPLLERIEQMDSRLRFVDALSGVFLILGLAGVALWARRGRSG